MAEMLLEQKLKEAAREHNAHISDNYQKLMDEALPPKEATLAPAYERTLEAAMASPAPAPAPAPSADAAARIADYRPLPASEEKISDGFTAYVTPPAATYGDDAAPTAPTMDTILRPTASVAQEQQVGFFAALSTRMKTALLCVAVAIIVAIALVIINTGIINSIDNDIAQKRIDLDRAVRSWNQIESKIQDATDPDNVGQWAQENGFILEQN